MNEFFHHGAVPLTSKAYVSRKFETEAFSELTSGKWVLLLGPRQHGKTSGLLRVKTQLGASGLPCAIVDLQRLPPLASYREVIRWVATQAARDFGVATLGTPPSDDCDDVAAWFKLALPPGSNPIVFILDEASAIADAEWRQAFYGQLRGVANQRADAKANTLAQYLQGR